MPNIQSPNMPDDPILFRGGKINKRELARMVLSFYPGITQDTFVTYFQLLFPDISYNHVYNLYRNVSEELRQFNLGNITKKNKIFGSKIVRKNNADSSLDENIEMSETESSSDEESETLLEFKRFVAHYKTVVRNPFLRELMKEYIMQVDESQASFRKTLAKRKDT